MSKEAIRVATGLRLGANLCVPHTCRCGAPVTARGSHGLSCMRSAGRQQRHAMINDIIHRSLGRVNIVAVKEPTLAGSNLRPDGATLIPWSSGKCLTWDATTPDTLAASHLPSTSNTIGAAAIHASVLKNQKYITLNSTFIFVAIAIETFGPWNVERLSFVRELGRRISQVTGDPRGPEKPLTCCRGYLKQCNWAMLLHLLARCQQEKMLISGTPLKWKPLEILYYFILLREWQTINR